MDIAITSLIPILSYGYIQYNEYINKYERKLKKTENLEKKDDIHDFLNDIDSYCPTSKNECLLSHNITDYAYQHIKKYGINNYLDKVTRKSKVFQTDKEYVFVFKENENSEENDKGNMLNVYHVSPLIYKKYTDWSTVKLEEKCGKGKCDLLKIMRQIKEASDNYENGGFIEYYWFDVVSQETIVKKSFVRKVKDVEYEGKKTNLYIGSGHTVKKASRSIDELKLNILLINVLLFILMWYYFDISKSLKNKRLSYTILIFSTIYLSSLMFDSYKNEFSSSTYNTHIYNIMTSAQVMATFIGSIIIYLKLFNMKYDQILFKLLVVSLIFTLISAIYYSSRDVETVKLVYLLKTISIINSSVVLILIFSILTLKKILK